MMKAIIISLPLYCWLMFPAQPKELPSVEPSSDQSLPTVKQLPISREATSDVFTPEEALIFRKRLISCWKIPPGTYDVGNFAVDIFVVFNSDATVKSETLKDKNDRYNHDSLYTLVANSALQALHDPACDPMPLPPKQYDIWNSMTIRFDPKEMLAP